MRADVRPLWGLLVVLALGTCAQTPAPPSGDTSEASARTPSAEETNETDDETTDSNDEDDEETESDETSSHSTGQSPQDEKTASPPDVSGSQSAARSASARRTSRGGHRSRPSDSDGPDEPPPSESGRYVTISVLTINIQTGMSEPPHLVDKRTRIVTDFIERTEPDVVAVQEISERPGAYLHRKDVLREATGYRKVWARTHYMPFFYEEGIGILSRWPIAWHGARSLPHPEFDKTMTRAVLGALVQHPHQPFKIYNAHLTIQSAPHKKADQALEALEFIHANHRDLPTFFAGDLNAEPEHDAMKLLRGHVTYRGTTGSLIDAWMATNPDDAGYTTASPRPDKRLDYIYVVPWSQSTTPLSCERVLTEKVDGVWPSDHFGVLCRFRISVQRRK
jgi:endonuclease/exonuclease/phosphatase family metal-dependent hydrolase